MTKHLFSRQLSRGEVKALSLVSEREQCEEHAVTATLPPQRPWIPLTRPNRTRPTCEINRAAVSDDCQPSNTPAPTNYVLLAPIESSYVTHHTEPRTLFNESFGLPIPTETIRSRT
ncbi:unnamed protein product [Danaus chrysippus]|uniref:(African queen) hypothetical protein n=1 Tax=Danaus chrysippus TaxID=151541 RepID=A0A8J2REY5_9NEOP|nr:unnamed protein product [Danaus chrysippus]